MRRDELATLLVSAAIAAFAIRAIAGTTATVVHNTSVFRPDGGTTLTIHDIKDGKTALEQCMDMAKAAPGKSTCTDVYGITTTGTCDDVAKPQWPLEKDADGYVIKPPIRAKQLSDTDWQTEIQDYVPAPYPTCWVLGWRIIADADLLDDAPELANSVEPMKWPDDVEATRRTVEDTERRHKEHLCYSDDVIPCDPPLPEVPSACGPYNGVGGGGPG